MKEKRRESRNLVKGNGFFNVDGSILEIKIRDCNSTGVGAYTSREVKPGQQGIIMKRDPDSAQMETEPGEVCWCLRDYMAEDASYPYRVGLRILG